jgi:hypothetical protein
MCSGWLKLFALFGPPRTAFGTPGTYAGPALMAALTVLLLASRTLEISLFIFSRSD